MRCFFVPFDKQINSDLVEERFEFSGGKVEQIVAVLVLIAVVAVVVFVARIVLLGLWRALKSVHRDGPDFMSKIFVSLGSSFVGGIIGSIITGASFQLAGGLSLAIATLLAFRS